LEFSFLQHLAKNIFSPRILPACPSKNHRFQTGLQMYISIFNAQGFFEINFQGVDIDMGITLPLNRLGL
jgi:hypothetical protein